MHRRVHSTSADNASQAATASSSVLGRRRKRSRPDSALDWKTLVNAILVFVGSFAIVLAVLVGLSSLLWGSLFAQTTATNHDMARKSGEASELDLDPLPWNSIYRVPDSMELVGDRSNHYVSLRKEVDPLVDHQLDELLSDLRKQQLNYLAKPMEMTNSDQVSYDIYNCPQKPPPGYPLSWKTMDIVTAWPTDDIVPPLDENNNALIHQSLCVFDYQKDYYKAEAYRDLQLPFVVVNDPEVEKATARWSLPDYMQRVLGNEPHRTEFSENNHFMYYVPPGKGSRRRGHPNLPEGWKPPTKMMRMSYQEWYDHAQTPRHDRDDPHWYFRLIGCGAMGNDGSCDRGATEALFDELPFFQPKKSLYVVEPGDQKGIHCRFGMPGVIAENHFDGSRNAIALFSGSRRYILSHPDQCTNLALYPKGHPSARHSAIDWSNPDVEEFPQFRDARSSEVVLQPGQVLYLPTNWFHYIVSLEINMQCNTRSGIESEMMHFVRECGF